MKVGVIGDIHLDLAGLEAALAGPLAGCGRYVVTGDMLDRGTGSPAAVLERIFAIPHVTVLAGNHELAYLGGPVYRGMREEGGQRVAPQLRDLVIDGLLRAATSIGDILCAHGGVSRDFWRAELEPTCGISAQKAAAELNRRFVRAVVRKDFSDPAFAALDSDTPGPFWASAREDLLDRDLPPFDQVVGHVSLEPEQWHLGARGRRVYSVCRERSGEGAGMVGCVVIAESAILGSINPVDATTSETTSAGTSINREPMPCIINIRRAFSRK